MSGRAGCGMGAYIANAMSSLGQTRPSLWNMSSNVLNATGFTRLYGALGQEDPYG